MALPYWTISYGKACRAGFSCRQCRTLIEYDTPMVIRDGRKVRLYYHIECYSKDPDPRTQTESSFARSHDRSSFQNEAPQVKGRGKWSVQNYGYSPNRDLTQK